MTIVSPDFKPRVIHCFRLPKGGVFRHVSDVIRGQSARGLAVGLVCDIKSDDTFADRELAELSTMCELGVHRIPISRTLARSDKAAIKQTIEICEKAQPDLVHGHGAKGGAYARLVASKVNAKSVYTPHGGSLHYAATSPSGIIYLTLEKLLKSKTEGLIFESHYSAGTYEAKLGSFPCERRVIHNGLRDAEFDCWQASDEHEFDFLFIGELRKLKGVDVLLSAVARLAETRKFRILLAGAGPDRDHFVKRIDRLNLHSHLELSPPIFPARDAFNRARCVIIPSLAESFPYVVLEALAAGVPVISTSVGGIPEIFDQYSDQLLPPGNVSALAKAMQHNLYHYADALEKTKQVQQHVKDHFGLELMNNEILAYYARVMGEM